MLLVERIPTLIVGVVTLALAVAIVAARPKDRLHQAFGVFLLARGGWYTFLAINQSILSLWGGYSVYYGLAIPFAAAWFAYHAHGRFFARKAGSRRHEWIPWALLIACAAVLSWYAVDDWLVIGGDWNGFFLLDLQWLAYAGVAWVLIRAAMQNGGDNHGQSLLLLGTAFMLDSAFRVALAIGNDMISAPEAWRIPSLVIHWGALGLLIDALRRLFVSGSRGVAISATLLLALAAASGLFAWWALPRTDGRLLKNSLEALWRLVPVVMGFYALVHCKFFGIQRRARRVVTGGTIAAPFAIVFFVAGESLEGWAIDTLGINSYVLGLAAAGIIGLFLFPLQRMAHRLAENLFPGVDGSDAYQARRREQMYRAAVEDAVSDRVITDRERLMLESVRNHLNLTPAQARGLEKAVMATVLAALPG